MNISPPPEFDAATPGSTLDSPSLRSIDRLREAIRAVEGYERALRAGEAPSIESIVEATPRAFRAEVVRALIESDREWRRRDEAAPAPTSADYASRFPDWTSVIEAVFAPEETARDTDDPSDGREDTKDFPTSSSDRFVASKEPFKRPTGQGVLYLATDAELRRDVVLKRPVGDGPRARRWFIREALVTGSLEHTSIVPVYSLNVDPEGRPFFVMRRIPGDTLSVRIKKFHAVDGARGWGRDGAPFMELLRAFVAVCDAVAFAHSRGILHRDLKPANVMLGEFGEVQVIDWGMALRLEGDDDEPTGEGGGPGDGTADPHASQAGVMLGTLGYISPEQAEGRIESMGAWSDVYSLGGVLYAILTGRSTLHDPDAAGSEPDYARLKERILEGDFPAPRSLDPSIPPELEAVCLKALALEPARRYERAAELGDEIRRWMADEPVKAYPEPFLRRAVRWARRRRTLAASLLTLILAVGAAATAGYVVVSAKNLELSAANEKILRSNGEIEAARIEAVTNFDQLRRTIRELLVDVAGSELPRSPGTEDVSLKIVNRALGELNTLMRRNPKNPDVAFDVAGCHREHGRVLRLMGRKEAAAAFREAIRILEELPDKTEYKDALAQACMDEGECLRMNGAPVEARPYYQRALAISEEILATNPGAIPALRTRAWVLCSAAADSTETGDFADGLKMFREAARLFGIVLGSGLAPEVDRVGECMALIGAGDCLETSGRTAEAEASLRRAVERAEALPRTLPEDRDVVMVLAEASHRLGRLLGRDRADESKPLLDRAVDLYTKLAAGSPRVAHYRLSRAEALLSRAETGRDADAVEAERVLGELLKESPGHPVYSGVLGRTEARLAASESRRGDREAARKRLEAALVLLERALAVNPGGALERRAADQIRKDLKKLDSDAARPRGQGM